MKWNGIVDFSKSVTNSEGNVQYHVVHKGTSFPTVPTPQEGQLFYRTDLDTIYAFDGTGWQKSVYGITAADVPVADSGGNFTATDVEGVLTEIDGRLDTVEDASATSKWNESSSVLSPKTTNAIVNITGNGTVGDALTVSVTGGTNDGVIISNSGSGDSLKVNTTHFVLDSNGKIAMGVAASSGAFIDIRDASNPSVTIMDTTNSCQLQLQALDTSVAVGAGSNHRLDFLINGSTSMILNTDGTLSIGTGAVATEQLDVNGGVKVGNSTGTNAGTIRYTVGNGFEGYHSGTWGALGGGNVFDQNEIFIGDNTATSDKTIWANNGDTNEPYIRYDESEDKWVMSNDGTTEADVGGGGGTTAYTTSFTNADLSSGVLTVTHSLSTQFVLTVVYDNNNKQIIPDDVTATSTSACAIDLSSFGTISGTWNVRCI